MLAIRGFKTCHEFSPGKHIIVYKKDMHYYEFRNYQSFLQMLAKGYKLFIISVKFCRHNFPGKQMDQNRNVQSQKTVMSIKGVLP